MSPIKYGAVGAHMPPPDTNMAVAKLYEEQGVDFMVWWDQLNLTIPRSIWTPDLVPAAALWDIDVWMDAWTLMTGAAIATERIELALVASDTMRRPPAVIAQLALSVQHYAEGRFMLALGAGEAKQFTPYGLTRDRPFTHLEEAIKIIRLLWEHNEPVSYDGPVWTLRNAILGLPPYGGVAPKQIVAGGPGKALRFAGELSDGWICYFPGSGTPEQFAEHIAHLRIHAENADRDPDALIIMAGFPCVIADTDAQVEEAINNPALLWDAAAMQPNGECWERAGLNNPLGPNWSYSRDLIPMDWSREDALAIVKRVPPEAVRATRIVGTPEQAAAQIQPWLEAGATHAFLGNYAPLVSSGNWGDMEGGNATLFRTIDASRKLNLA
jgi:phthiodiolone/phenolphthiodiolone dimycocerosates ketoreductase